MNLRHPLILASRSPRRRSLLEQAGFTFTCEDPGDAEEAVSFASSPEALAIEKAVLKARLVAEQLAPKLRKPHWVLGADTIAELHGEILGKPMDRSDASRMLRRLSGTKHRVITGLCLWLTHPPGFELQQELLHVEPLRLAESTWVWMRPLSEAEILAYVDSGEADGKAGAYAIQETGDLFVQRIEGSFANVVGLPLERFIKLMNAVNV